LSDGAFPRLLLADADWGTTCSSAATSCPGHHCNFCGVTCDASSRQPSTSPPAACSQALDMVAWSGYAAVHGARAPAGSITTHELPAALVAAASSARGTDRHRRTCQHINFSNKLHVFLHEIIAEHINLTITRSGDNLIL
jgi:hypothetical protein